MELVLVRDVEKLGKKGDVVDVSKGYGVNYLVAKGFGVSATKEAIRQAKAASVQKKEQQEELGGKVEHLAKEIAGKSFQVKAKATKGGRLYGSLDAVEVIGQLEKVWKIKGTGIHVEIDLAQPIRETGRYPLEVTISSDDRSEKVEIILTVILE